MDYSAKIGMDESNRCSMEESVQEFSQLFRICVQTTPVQVLVEDGPQAWPRCQLNRVRQETKSENPRPFMMCTGIYEVYGFEVHWSWHNVIICNG